MVKEANRHQFKRLIAKIGRHIKNQFRIIRLIAILEAEFNRMSVIRYEVQSKVSQVSLPFNHIWIEW